MAQITLDRILQMERDNRLFTENRDPDLAERILMRFRSRSDLTLTAAELDGICRGYRQRISELRELGFKIEWNGRRRDSAFTLVNP